MSVSAENRSSQAVTAGDHRFHTGDETVTLYGGALHCWRMDRDDGVRRLPASVYEERERLWGKEDLAYEQGDGAADQGVQQPLAARGAILGGDDDGRGGAALDHADDAGDQRPRHQHGDADGDDDDENHLQLTHVEKEETGQPGRPRRRRRSGRPPAGRALRR